MSFYVDTSSFSCYGSITGNNSDSCAPHGSCTVNNNFPDHYICLCDTYYNVFTNCTDNLFEEYNSTSLILYPTLGITLVSIILAGYIWAFFVDIKTKGIKSLNQIVTIAKIFILCYCIFRISSFVLFISELVNEATIYSSAELICHIIAIGILLMLYVICTIKWMTLLNRIKNIGMLPRVLIILKNILTVFVVIVFPFGIIVNILSVLQIARDITDTLAAISVVILIMVPLLINSVLTIKALISINNIKLEDITGSLMILKKKTYFLLTASIILLINFLQQIVTLGWFSDSFDVIMTRKFTSLTVEVIISVLFWLFLQKIF